MDRVAVLQTRTAPIRRFTDDGWFKTGDIVTIADRGCIEIADRSKDLVKSGGEWISSVALETALMGHPAVAEAAVIAVPHPKWDERPLAVVVLKQGQHGHGTKSCWRFSSRRSRSGGCRMPSNSSTRFRAPRSGSSRNPCCGTGIGSTIEAEESVKRHERQPRKVTTKARRHEEEKLRGNFWIAGCVQALHG